MLAMHTTLTMVIRPAAAKIKRRRVRCMCRVNTYNAHDAMARGEGRKGGKGRTPVPDCESAKVATLKCGGPPTKPEENRGPWSKKFENRCFMR